MLALVNSDIITNLYADQETLDASVTPELAAQAVTVPDGAQVGWRLVEGEWSAPDPAEAPEAPGPARKRVVDRQTMLAMIPANVEFAIRQYAQTETPADDPTYVARGIVSILLRRVDTADNINLDLPANIAGFQFLVTLNLMTQDQADDVLAGPLV